ncbi:MAG: hypothetical protein WD314_16205 [Trueperaceae bacterium]
MQETQEFPSRRSRKPDWQRLAPELSGYAWRVLLVTVAVALIAGVLYPASRTSIPEDPLLQSFDCPAPPCFPQTPASRLADVLVKLPPFGYAAALLLCLPGLIVGTRFLLAGRDSQAGPLLIGFLGTGLVLVGIDILPHVLNPCLSFGPQLPGLCGEFASRWDVQARWHTLLHAFLGAVPFTVAFAWLSGRWRPGSRAATKSARQ